MAKRKAVVRDTLGDDIVDRLRDLHKQATVERSHYRQVRERRHQRELRKALGIVEGVSNWARTARSR